MRGRTPVAPDLGPGDLLEPAEILKISPEQADALLRRLEATVPAAPPLEELSDSAATEAIVFGDTHGDWRSTLEAARRFLVAPKERRLVGLGDYIDRAPDDCAEGSVANALYLLQLVSRFPDRVVLVKGNHELTRIIPVMPHELDEEVDALWGPDVQRYARLLGLLERGPYAAVSSSGVYFAHGGFPRAGEDGGSGKAAFEKLDEDSIVDIVWGECAASRSRRGVGDAFTEFDLKGFLRSVGARVFLRGHDPDLAGKRVFGGTCLTLHTSRLYERFGGVLVARVPLDRPVTPRSDIPLEHLETERRVYPIP